MRFEVATVEVVPFLPDGWGVKVTYHNGDTRTYQLATQADAEAAAANEERKIRRLPGLDLVA